MKHCYINLLLRSWGERRSPLHKCHSKYVLCVKNEAKTRQQHQSMLEFMSEDDINAHVER